jgi:hypothetical protein
MASAPNDSWFYLIENRPVGPMSGEQLRAAVSAGQVGPETPVHRAGWPEWRRAADVPGVFPDAVPVAPGRSPPPPPVAPMPAPGFPIQVEASDQVPRALQGAKRKGHKNSSAAPVLWLSGLVVVCLAAAVAVWIVQTRRDPPTETPVAALPEKPQPEEHEDAKADDWERNRPKPVDDGFAFPALRDVTEQGGQHSTFELSDPPSPRGRLDELVFAKWEELDIEPANLCSDAVFLRRAYLDVIGTLPTVEEARAFLTDESADKRERLIDALLERPEYADYWAMRWSDVLRVKAEFPINLWPNAAQAYHRWIHHAMATNMPYDQFARELLTSSGSNFRQGQVNFYRAVQNNDPRSLAQAAALAFLGERAERWPTERLDGMAGFFAKVGFKPTREWKEEIIIFDPTLTVDASLKPVFPDGTAVEIPWDQDPRVVFADWLMAPENPWFARQIVNRVWYWLQGRGIVHEPDDVRPDNPPSNPELLDYLAEELVRANYDLKHVMRLILNSSTYQLSPIPRSDRSDAAAHFASYTVRRLDAEVIIDALNQITGTTESYSSIIPEPYTFIPETHRAVALPDGSIISSFLELFARPPRDTGMLSERTNTMTAGQRLHLLNSSHIRNKIRNGSGIKKLLAQGDSRENLYLAILSRFPGDGDWGGGEGEQLAWTLINTTEFLFRH